MADEAGKIYAVDAAARRLRWERTLELDAGVLNPVVADASPAIGTNGVVYIGAQNGRLYAFDAATGSPRWSHLTGGEIDSTAAIGADGTVFVASDRLYALNGQSGARRWSTLPREAPSGYFSPVIGADGTVFVVGTRLYAVQPDTGAIRWTAPSIGGGAAGASPAIDDEGTLYVGAMDTVSLRPMLFAVDGNSGVAKWALPTLDIPLGSPVLGLDDRVLIGTERRFLAVHRRTGQKLWEIPAVGPFWGSAAVDAGGTVYLQTGGKRIAVDGLTGQRRWETAGNGWSGASPAIDASGILWIAQGSLAAIATGSTGPAKSPWPKFRGTLSNDGRTGPAPVIPPTLVQEPVSVEVTLGGMARFTVSAQNATSYQWLRDQVPIPGATNAELVLRARRMSDAGRYRAIAIGAGGSVLSASAGLTVTTPVQHHLPVGLVSTCPTVGPDGSVYFGTDRTVRAVNGTTGQENWRFTTVGNLQSAIPLGPDGSLFPGTCCWNSSVLLYDHRVYALDAATGAQRWEFLSDTTVSSAPTLGNNGLLYVTFGEALYAIFQDTGRWKWWRTIHPKEASPAFGTDGTLYWFCNNSGIRRVDAASGSLRGACESSLNPGQSSPAIGPRNTVYLGSRSPSGRVLAFDGGTGELRWSTLLPYPVETTPALGLNGALYVGSSDFNNGALVALDAATGTIRWTSPVGPLGFQSSPTVGADGVVYLSGLTRLSAVDGETGELRWELAIGPASEPALAENGLLWVGTTGGLTALKTSSAGLANTTWPKFRGNAANTGQPRAVVPERPRIITQPKAVQVLVGQPARLEISAEGPDRFQWKKDGVILPGATQSVLDLPAVRIEDDGVYTVEVGNAVGTQASVPARLTVLFPPQVSSSLPSPGGPILLGIRAPYDLPWTLESSRALDGWSPVQNGVGSGPGIPVPVALEMPAGDESRFWRVRATWPE